MLHNNASLCLMTHMNIIESKSELHQVITNILIMRNASQKKYLTVKIFIWIFLLHFEALFIYFISDQLI